MRSIQKLESGRESAFKGTDEIDIEIAKHGQDSTAGALLRRLKDAYNNRILASERSVADERKRAACDGPLARLNEKMHEAETEMMADERELQFGDGSFTPRDNRRKGSEERFLDTINAIRRHRSTCRHCFASR